MPVDNYNIDLFLYQLYSINYPSLRDNNILRRVLVNEVLYWAEELKKRWVEERTAEGDGALCPPTGGADSCHRVWSMGEQTTGKQPNS